MLSKKPCYRSGYIFSKVPFESWYNFLCIIVFWNFRIFLLICWQVQAMAVSWNMLKKVIIIYIFYVHCRQRLGFTDVWTVVFFRASSDCWDNSFWKIVPVRDNDKIFCCSNFPDPDPDPLISYRCVMLRVFHRVRSHEMIPLSQFCILLAML